ncbi:MAG: bifunctional phosphoribosyl-AMP cyclohydrolase/phosphoribosyl-ATP diphosphatase HisIE [Ferruginibacter sp.]
MSAINFNKYADGLAPCIVQDAATQKVLMLGFMNEEAYTATQQSGKVTFYSRSKQRLWTKGEESGHFLYWKQVLTDCDADTILVKATPAGPVCHTGADTCFNEKNQPVRFIDELEGIIAHRKLQPDGKSYTASLFAAGINTIAQKVGEEAVETIIEAKDSNDELFKNEAADLLFHYLVLLQAKGFTLADIENILQQRHAGK